MRFFRIIGAIVLAGLILALGVGIYQAGLMAGAAGNGASAAPHYWYGAGAWFGPWFGFGFGLFHFLGFLLFILLIVALVRLVFWGGRGRRGWGTGYGPGWGTGPDSPGPNGPRGPMGPGGEWEQRMREYHDQLHASGAAHGPGRTDATGSSSGQAGAAQAGTVSTNTGQASPGATGAGPSDPRAGG